MISTYDYGRILRICASQPIVREAVFANHDNNRWWPLSVDDWRIRMIVAGLSTRVSYQMIETYQKVVAAISSFSYEQLSLVSDSQFRRIVKPLGLVNARTAFWRSMMEFLRYLEINCIDVRYMHSDELIEQIRSHVYGAGYKVAQCCVLYARGYHSGIMPVDSGMADYLCPAIGLVAPHTAAKHEVLRKQLEALTTRVDCMEIATDLGYGSLDLPPDKPLTWWAHLVLIYYKRFFCSKRDPAGKPLRESMSTKDLCARRGSRIGGIKNIVIEGLDGVGKTSLARMLSVVGFKYSHAKYSPGCDLYPLYREALEQNGSLDRRFVLDRTFLSEAVYGPILRGHNRLTDDEIDALLNMLREQNSLVVYMHAPADVLAERLSRCRESSNHTAILDNHDDLAQGYESVMNIAERYVPVIRVDSQKSDTRHIFSKVLGFAPPRNRA